MKNENELKIKMLKKERRNYLNMLFAIDDGIMAASDLDRRELTEACANIEAKLAKLI